MKIGLLINKSGAIKVLFLLIALTVGIGYIAWHIDEFKRLLHISLVTFVIITILNLLSGILNGYQIKLFMRIFGISMSFLEWYPLAIMTTLANYLPFQGGLITKGVYLKNLYNFPYSSYVAVSVARYVIAFFSMGSLGIIASLIIGLNSTTAVWIFIFFVFLLALGLLLSLLSPKTFEVKNKLMHNLMNILVGWKQITQQKLILMGLILVDIILLLLHAFRFFVSFVALGIAVPVSYCLFITPLAILLSLVSIVPGALGIREFIVGFQINLLGLRMQDGILASSLDRGIGMIWLCLIGAFCAVIFAKKAAVQPSSSAK